MKWKMGPANTLFDLRYGDWHDQTCSDASSPPSLGMGLHYGIRGMHILKLVPHPQSGLWLIHTDWNSWNIPRDHGTPQCSYQHAINLRSPKVRGSHEHLHGNPQEELSERAPQQVILNLGSPDVLALLLQTAVSSPARGKGFWEFESKNIWGPEVGSSCSTGKWLIQLQAQFRSLPSTQSPKERGYPPLLPVIR